jgi:hypothetical protein
VNPHIPRDEIVPWLYGDEDADDQDDDDDVVDLSELFGDDVIDGGVTSGADPSSWDPIDIDKKP